MTGAPALVLGAYPSALHIRWTHPLVRIAALAVAPEPWPFWDGGDEVERVARWRHQIGWRPEWGRADPAGRLNGSSGRFVRDAVLEPLGIDPDAVWFTDALPFFHVKRGGRGQGDAMSKRYDPFAVQHGLPRHDLPDRPPAAQLVLRATHDEGGRIVEELMASGTELVVTLGNEALAVVAGLVDGVLPYHLSPGDDYGTRLAASANGRSFELLPLLHPGQRRRSWQEVHERWARQLNSRTPRHKPDIFTGGLCVTAGRTRDPDNETARRDDRHRSARRHPQTP